MTSGGDNSDSMKLYVDVEPGNGINGRNFKIYNQRGERLRCITGANVRYRINDAARIDLSLVVNGRDIVFGRPPILDNSQD